jgi:AcrR family transcriptional regulator
MTNTTEAPPPPVGDAGPSAGRPRRPSARATILALAIDVLDAQGEVGIRVNQLADQAGVTAPTLYRHFGSRDGLVVAAQAARYARTLRTTTEDASPELARCTTREEVRCVLTQVLTAYATEEGARRRRERLNVLGGAYARPELARAIVEAQREATQGVEAFVRVLQAKGLASPDVDPETFAAWLTGMILGRSLIELEGASADGERWNRLAIDAVCAVLLGPSVS